MWFIIVAAFHILGVLSSINAVMTARTSQGAIAWVISLNTFPYIAVPAYWFLGRSKFKGYVRARKSDEVAVNEKLDEVLAGVDAFRVPAAAHTGTGRAAEGLADLPYLSGNDLKLLIDGNDTFDNIIEGIDAAKDYILFQFFIVKDDGIGRKVKDHLVAKAKEGVRIFFLYDEVGSKDLTKAYKNELREAGVLVHEFHTQKGIGNRFQINFRNHRKIVVVDGQVSWVGGHNVGDEYLGLDPKFGNWRDTHMRIDGPATVALQISFVEDWYWATDEYISGPGLDADQGGIGRQGGPDRPHRPGRSPGDGDPDVSSRDQLGPGTHLDRQSLLRPGRRHHLGPPIGRPSRSGCAHPDSGQARSPARLPGCIHLFRGREHDGGSLLQIHRRLPAPESDAGR